MVIFKVSLSWCFFSFKKTLVVLPKVMPTPPQMPFPSILDFSSVLHVKHLRSILRSRLPVIDRHPSSSVIRTSPSCTLSSIDADCQLFQASTCITERHSHQLSSAIICSWSRLTASTWNGHISSSPLFDRRLHLNNTTPGDLLHWTVSSAPFLCLMQVWWTYSRPTQQCSLGFTQNHHPYKLEPANIPSGLRAQAQRSFSPAH